MKGWITQFILICIVFTSMLSVGCDKRKALATVRQADELAAKLVVYGRNIAKANNDSFEAKNISLALHHAVNEGADKYLTGVDKLLDGIKAAKAAVATGADPNGQVDILEAIFNTQVRDAGLALVASFVNIPQELRDKIGGWAAAIELAFITFRGLFADVRTSLAPNTA